MATCMAPTLRQYASDALMARASRSKTCTSLWKGIVKSLTPSTLAHRCWCRCAYASSSSVDRKLSRTCPRCGHEGVGAVGGRWGGSSSAHSGWKHVRGSSLRDQTRV